MQYLLLWFTFLYFWSFAVKKKKRSSVFCVEWKKNKVIQDWSDMKGSEWWSNDDFWGLTVPLNIWEQHSGCENGVVNIKSLSLISFSGLCVWSHYHYFFHSSRCSAWPRGHYSTVGLSRSCVTLNKWRNVHANISYSFGFA